MHHCKIAEDTFYKGDRVQVSVKTLSGASITRHLLQWFSGFILALFSAAHYSNDSQYYSVQRLLLTAAAGTSGGRPGSESGTGRMNASLLNCYSIYYLKLPGALPDGRWAFQAGFLSSGENRYTFNLVVNKSGRIKVYTIHPPCSN